MKSTACLHQLTGHLFDSGIHRLSSPEYVTAAIATTAALAALTVSAFFFTQAAFMALSMPLVLKASLTITLSIGGGSLVVAIAFATSACILSKLDKRKRFWQGASDIMKPISQRPNTRNWLYTGLTLNQAIEQGQFCAVKKQLAAGAPLRDFRHYPLVEAVKRGHVRIALHLLEDPYQTVSENDFSSAYKAAESLDHHGHPKGPALLALLSRFQTSDKRRPGPYGNTGLMKALCEGRWGDARRILLIKGNFHDLDVANSLHFTPRMLLTHLKLLPLRMTSSDTSNADRILLYASALGGHGYFLEGRRISPLAIHSTTRADGKLGPTPLSVAHACACAGSCGSVMKLFEAIGSQEATLKEQSKHRL